MAGMLPPIIGIHHILITIMYKSAFSGYFSLVRYHIIAFLLPRTVVNINSQQQKNCVYLITC